MTMSLKTLTRLNCTIGLLATSTSQAQTPAVGMHHIQSNGMPITLACQRGSNRGLHPNARRLAQPRIHRLRPPKSLRPDRGIL
jgi:hypothetical protein